MQLTTALVLVTALLVATGMASPSIAKPVSDNNNNNHVNLDLAGGIHTWWGQAGECSMDISSSWCNQLCIDEAKRDNIVCKRIGGQMVRWMGCVSGAWACSCGCVDWEPNRDGH